MEREFITKRGLNKLNKELEVLVKIKRPQIAEKIREAVSFGDITENAEYAEAKDEQAFIEGRIMEIEETLRTVTVVQPAVGRTVSTAQIGCAVGLSAGAQRKNFIIVGKGESNPSKNEVSSDSPVGQAMLGKKIGDRIMVSTPGGNKQYKIVKIA